MPIASVHGRDGELESLRSFLVASLPGAFLLRGEPGIGKSTLWEPGLALALDTGRCVLSCRPTAAEAELSFVALGDLLEGVLEEILPALPGPQRRALEVALLLEEPAGTRPDRRAIAVAFTRGVRELAAAGPLLLAIDDLQWLDAASADVLAFAARRLGDDPVALLLAERISGPVPLPLGLDRASPERLRSLSLPPLSLGALHEMLRAQLGASFPRLLLRRIETLSGGNPFFALQLARAVQAGRDIETVLPAGLGLLVRMRLDSLPKETRPALLAVALLAEPTLSLLERAVPGAALEPALAAARLLAARSRKIVGWSMRDDLRASSIGVKLRADTGVRQFVDER